MGSFLGWKKPHLWCVLLKYNFYCSRHCTGTAPPYMGCRQSRLWEDPKTHTTNKNTMATTHTTIDRSVIRQINSLLDEGDDGTKVVIDMNIFTADTIPTDVELRAFHNRHCPTLDYDSVKTLLKELLLQKRSVSVQLFMFLQYTSS
jgi:hypothetical protein